MDTEVPPATRRGPARRAGTAARWALQLALAAVFAMAGLAELGGDPQMVRLFADIGAGQQLRYLIGALEVAGAVGLLVPRLAGPAALGLVGLMVGATVTKVVVLAVGRVLTLGLLVAAGAVAWLHHDQSGPSPADGRPLPVRRCAPGAVCGPMRPR